MSASALIQIIPADPDAWRQGFLNLRLSVPCPGLTLQSWAGVHEKCVDFLDHWADEAAALGWTTIELFGVHPDSVLKVEWNRINPRFPIA